MFRVFTTKEFDDRFEKIDESEKKRFRKILNQLREKGPIVGKPLKVSYFREKKFKGKRLYFICYKNYMVILAIAISDKKMQQETIKRIISRFNYYREFVLDKLKEID
ncbi:hypothetical protein K9L16_01770 [Candidatus Pacearchaeota archaeon]|nr:hypothetical protein [Candidatus Pacearchaeota archaeon]